MNTTPNTKDLGIIKLDGLAPVKDTGRIKLGGLAPVKGAALRKA